jgi:hypothetical protein
VSDVRTEMTVTDDGQLIVSRTQDCEAIVERAKALHNAGTFWSASRDYVHAASIPNAIVEKYCNENGVKFAEAISDETHLRRIMLDPDYSALRVWKGRI